jgi:purine nucleosidase
MEQTGEDGISLPDPIAMSIAIDPSVCTEWSTHHVDVETHSELTRGMTLVDRLHVAADDRNHPVWSHIVSKGHNANVCWTIDTKRWKETLFAALK